MNICVFRMMLSVLRMFFNEVFVRVKNGFFLEFRAGKAEI